jgi:hypothetical protein
MSFRDHMKKIVEDVPGTLACTLMGFDGIAIDSYELGGADVDVATLMTEYSSIAHQIRRALEAQPATGDLNEFVLQGSQLTAVVRPLSGEYFLAALMKPEALAAKTRYLMRVAAPKILQELTG